MDDQKFDMLRDEIKEVKEDVKEVRSDVKDLLGFKYKVMGVVVACTAIFGAVFNYIIK